MRRPEGDACSEGGAERADGGDGESGPWRAGARGVDGGVRRRGSRPARGCHDEACQRSVGGRELDIVLFGATGFTGALTADYLARNGPEGLRWALAGRSLDKLEKVRAQVGVGRRADRRRLRRPRRPGRPGAPATKVVISTVGPYVGRGEALVGACADAGTDYCDITGEARVRRPDVRRPPRDRESHPAPGSSTAAASTPSRYDLGAMFTVEHLPADVPIDLRGVVRAGALPSGGTFETALTGMSRVRQIREAAQARKRVEPKPVGRSSRAVAGKPHRDKLLGYWLLPLPTMDPVIVARSGAALPTYGPKFRYSHYAGTKTLRVRRRRRCRRSTGSALAAQVKPARELLMKWFPAGDGPDPSDAASRGSPSTSSARPAARPCTPGSPAAIPATRETAMMLAESALCLASRRQPRRRRPGDHRPGDGRQPAGPRAGRRAEVRGALTHLPDCAGSCVRGNRLSTRWPAGTAS